MHILSFTPLTLIAISGMLVSAGPIVRDTTQPCGIPKPFTGEKSCTPCKSSNDVCGTLNNKPTMLYCAGSPTRQWIPINNPSTCTKTGSSTAKSPTAKSPTAKSPRAAQAASTPGCKSGKPFQQKAGCSKCEVEGKLVCGRDEDRIADLRCTRFGPSLSWVPVDAPGKCGV